MSAICIEVKMLIEVYTTLLADEAVLRHNARSPLPKDGLLGLDSYYLRFALFCFRHLKSQNPVLHLGVGLICNNS